MRPFNRNANVGRGGGGGGRHGGGPLISDHLRDLDLELELLKRKREMIEKQQNLLNQQQSFNRASYNYDQPQTFRNHQPFNDGPQFSGSNHAFSSSSRDFSNSNRDFSHLYNEPQQSRNHFPRQSAKKRLGDYVWSDPPTSQTFNYEPPAKKYFPQPKKFKPGPSNRSKYVPQPEQPAFVPKKQGAKPAPSQRFKEAPQRPRPNDFKPTKVTKPNKPTYNTRPYPAPKVNENSPILDSDKVPSQQTVGRLELALGAVLKNVKDKYGNQPAYAHCFIENSSTRGMKQLIRERIRETMLGKPVGNIAQIMQEYRAVYPAHTDKDIVEAGLRKKDVLVTKTATFSSMNPYQFFKRNYVRLMSVSLTKMFARLEAVTKEESAQLLKSEGHENPNTKASNETVETEDADLSKDTDLSKDFTKDITENSEQMLEEPAENTDNPAENVENPEENSEQPAVNEEKPKKAVIEETEVGKEIEETLHEKHETMLEEADNPAENVEKPEENAEQPAGNEEKPKKALIEESEVDKEIKATIREKYETMLDEVMMKRLTIWLPRLKTQILKVLGHDITFERAKQAIIKETNVRLQMANEPIGPNSEISKLEQAIMNKLPHKLEYHVKIQGRPTLPKKPMMTEFLQQFNPKLVKKIKNVRNLLYVGFDNKDDFDRIVAANGTFVGNDKIIVKISQWVTSSALNADGNISTPNTSTMTDNDVSMKDAELSKESNEELNDILNDQIDELLTSIRNEEESDNVEENNEGVEEAVVENQDVAENKNVADNQDVAQNQVSGTTEENAQKDSELIDPERREVIDLVEEDDETPNQEKEGPKDTESDEAKDKVEEIKTKETGRATPVRASTRLASAPSTPCSIRTRRTSKLAKN